MRVISSLGCLLVLTIVAAVGAFAPVVPQQKALFVPSRTPVVVSRRHQPGAVLLLAHHDDNNNNIELKTEANDDKSLDNMVTKVTALSILLWMASTEIASAAGPDWGIFEGRTGSLLHPITMGSLLLFSLYTGFLGWQWRRQRMLGDEITALKKTLPDLGGAKTVQAALEAAKAAPDDASQNIASLEAAVSTENQINDLVAERKDLSSQGLRDKHYRQASLLAFIGTAFAIVGPLNTYARAGKLFPGPHLYAGASVVVLWAAAAACVPAMSKGNDTARSLHIGINAAGIGLFVWQVVSGIPILLKVIENTKWP